MVAYSYKPRVAKVQTGSLGLAGHPAYPKDDPLGLSSGLYMQVHTCPRTLLFLQMESMRCVRASVFELCGEPEAGSILLHSDCPVHHPQWLISLNSLLLPILLLPSFLFEAGSYTFFVAKDDLNP